MSGGLLNIKAEGTNNVFLTGNPSKTFFKTTYAKHTNFGLQRIRTDYQGLRSLRATQPSYFTFKIKRLAELLMDTHIVVTLPDIYSPIYPPTADTSYQWSPYEFRWIDHLGSIMVQEITLTVGGQLIQQYDGAYFLAAVERDFNTEKKRLYHSMTGHTPELNDPGNAFGRTNVYPNAYYTSTATGAEPSIRGRTIYIPINTNFTMDSRCAFPLVSLQYNELHINVTLRPLNQLFRIRDVFDATNGFPYISPDFNQQYQQMYRFLQTPPAVDISIQSNVYENTISDWNADIHLISTYCFLGKEEAKVFAKEDQIYLCKDVFSYRFPNIQGTCRQSLTSSGMISSWMFYLQRNDVNLRNEWTNYTNWPYSQLPADVIPAPSTDTNSTITGAPINSNLTQMGPLLNPDGFSTGIYTTGPLNPDNRKEILQTFGILLNGELREQSLEVGIFNYIEKYTRTPSFAREGLYCYNFCMNSDSSEYQPSGAINLALFKNIELEITTILPTVDPINSNFGVICDSQGNVIGVQKQNYRLFEYAYDLVVFEERYNILHFIGGNCAMMYAR